MNSDATFTSDPWEAESLSYPSAVRTFYDGNGNCYASKESGSGQLLFFVTAEGRFDLDIPKKYQGFSLEIKVNPNDTTHLICTLNDIKLSEYFAQLAKSVAKDTCGCEGRILIEKTIETINNWSSLFKPDKKRLSFEEYIGFWGELYFLYFELMPNVEFPENIPRYWTGPTGQSQNTAKQDFTFDNIAFELKTTMAGSDKDIRISSKDQLDKITERLYLIHLFVNQTDSHDGNSLQEIFDLIRERLSQHKISDLEFFQKAEPFRSRASDQQLHDKLSFSGLNIYLVEENFPLLTNKNIREGIISVKYTISASSIIPFIVNKTIKDIINE